MTVRAASTIKCQSVAFPWLRAEEGRRERLSAWHGTDTGSYSLGRSGRKEKAMGTIILTPHGCRIACWQQFILWSLGRGHREDPDSQRVSRNFGVLGNGVQRSDIGKAPHLSLWGPSAVHKQPSFLCFSWHIIVADVLGYCIFPCVSGK